MQQNIHHIHELEDREHVFADRQDAGRVVAEMLPAQNLRDQNAVVLAIPSGGVPVGMVVARALHLPMDVAVVRKLQIPGNTEAGFGAMALGGEPILNQSLVTRLGLDQQTIERQRRATEVDLKEREYMYRGGRPFPDLSGRTALLTDDGIASGYTNLAAAELVRNAGAQRIVVAVPTASKQSAEMVAEQVDEVYCANLRTRYPFAVASAYVRWRDLPPDQTTEQWRRSGIPLP